MIWRGLHINIIIFWGRFPILILFIILINFIFIIIFIMLNLFIILITFIFIFINFIIKSIFIILLNGLIILIFIFIINIISILLNIYIFRFFTIMGGIIYKIITTWLLWSCSFSFGSSFCNNTSTKSSASISTSCIGFVSKNGWLVMLSSFTSSKIPFSIIKCRKQWILCKANSFATILRFAWFPFLENIEKLQSATAVSSLPKSTLESCACAGDGHKIDAQNPFINVITKKFKHDLSLVLGIWTPSILQVTHMFAGLLYSAAILIRDSMSSAERYLWWKFSHLYFNYWKQSSMVAPANPNSWDISLIDLPYKNLKSCNLTISFQCTRLEPVANKYMRFQIT